jgi:hypothetical protein
MQELPFHGVDLGKICCDVMIAAALSGHEAEVVAREFRRWACAAEMNDRSQLVPLLTADFCLSATAKNTFTVQEHRRKFCGVARHDSRI